jgi:hypothetical protein
LPIIFSDYTPQLLASPITDVIAAAANCWCCLWQTDEQMIMEYALCKHFSLRLPPAATAPGNLAVWIRSDDELINGHA